MKQNLVKAIILKRINYSEADRILTVITPEKGKLSLLAKGSRRSNSKLAGGLELFSVSQIGFIDGRSDLKIITSTNLSKNFSNIVKNINSTMLAYEFLRLIDDSTQDSCDSSFFELLEVGLQSINDAEQQLDIINVWFIAQLLMLSGQSLNTENQLNGQKFLEDKNYEFSFDDMAFYENINGIFGPKHIKFLRILSKVSTPSNLLHIADATSLASELKTLMQQAMAYKN